MNNNHGDFLETNAFKKQRIGEDGSSADSTMSERLNAPQAGGSLPGGPGSQVVATIIRNPRINKLSQTFTKKWQFYTGGFKNEIVTNSNMMASEGDRISQLLGPTNKSLLTSLAAITPDCLSLFMSPIEYENLPKWTYATKLNIKVTPLGYRLPFSTNESASTFANSQTIVQIASAIGLNTQMPVLEGAYNPDATDPSDIASVKTLVRGEEYTKLLYGDTQQVGIGGLGACLGLPVNWNNYTIIPLLSEGSIVSGYNSPMLTNFINIQNINDCKGTPIIDYSYSTKNGLIKWDPLAFQRKILSSSTTNWKAIDTGFNSSLPTERKDKGIDGTPTAQVTTFGWCRDPMSSLLAPTYDMRVEKSHWMVRNDGQNLSSNRPPLLHFGALPVQSNPVLAATSTWAPVAAMWEIETSMECEYNNDFINAGNYMLNNASFDPIEKIVYNFQWETQSPTLYVTNKFPIREQDTYV